MIESKKTNNFLIALLLVLSGDPVFYKQSWAATGYAIIAVILLFAFKKHIGKTFFKRFVIFESVFLLIFVIQYFNLGSVPPNFILGFIIKGFIGALIFTVVGNNFSFAFYDVMYKICLISIPLFIVQLVWGDDVLSSMFLHEESKSIGIYTFRPRAAIESSVRNSALFWEPGAFQGYINLALFANFHRIPYLIKNRKFSLVIIVLALISTLSTTGYFVFALLIGGYTLVYTKMNKGVSLFIVTIFMILGSYLFFTLDFLGEKVESQYESAMENEGEFNPERLGALLFDLHYIQKNPLTGNGFQPQTRYADHHALRDMELRGETLGHGNGFSNFIASAGIIGMLWYLIHIYRFQRTKINVRDPIFLIIIIIILLQGEDFLRFPFFLAIAFFKPFTFKPNNET